MIDSTVAAIYEGWEVYQGKLVKAVTPLTADQLALRAAPGLRPVHDLLTHLIAVRVRWFHRGAGAEPERADLDEIGTWDRPAQPVRTPAELLAGLETSWQVIKNAIGQWTPDELSTPFTVSYAGTEQTFTRNWIIWHVLEHDLHHGGEISFSLGMHGLPGLDL
jgi:uncharacterized damage-inducible protein DinB